MERKEIAQLLAGISREMSMGIKDSEIEDNFNGSTFDMTFDRITWGKPAFKIRTRIIVTQTPIKSQVSAPSIL